MVSFCEGYKGLRDSLQKSLNDLADAAFNKQEEMMNSSVKTESVLFEDTSVKEGSTKMKLSNEDNTNVKTSSVITSAVRQYSTGILTAVEKNYLDYMTVLQKLVPREGTNRKEKTKNTENENNDNKDTEQNK